MILSRQTRRYFPEGYCSAFSILLLFVLLLDASCAGAEYTYLAYLEAQAVGGYSEAEDGPVFHSMDKDDVMQKTGIGFDYTGRLSGAGGDYGVIAVQGRLAYDDAATRQIEPQLYNAYFKYKAGFADLWAGHNRVALGISSYLDSHAQLMPDPAMLGFSYDRDWGIGALRDFEQGNLSISATTGSGMGLYARGNYLLASHASKGILSQDNYNLGVSAAYGKILDVMGYELMMPHPMKYYSVGADFTYLRDNLESRLDIMAGEKSGKGFYAIWWRFGISMYEEGRLKLELQPVFWETGEDRNFQGYGGLSFQVSGDLTLRTMYVYDEAFNDDRMILQLYWYHKI